MCIRDRFLFISVYFCVLLSIHAIGAGRVHLTVAVQRAPDRRRRCIGRQVWVVATRVVLLECRVAGQLLGGGRGKAPGIWASRPCVARGAQEL
eukprot:3984588-Alexandrium_andersonii.AAC.1